MTVKTNDEKKDQLMRDFNQIRTVLHLVDKIQRDVQSGDFDVTAIPTLINKVDFPRLAMLYFINWQHAYIKRGGDDYKFIGTLEELIFKSLVCVFRYPLCLPLCGAVSADPIESTTYMKKLKFLRANRDLSSGITRPVLNKVYIKGGDDE